MGESDVAVVAGVVCTSVKSTREASCDTSPRVDGSRMGPEGAGVVVDVGSNVEANSAEMSGGGRGAEGEGERAEERG